MTHPSTIARDSAQHCEAKKHGLRQTQDGIVVSFVLHPNEVPAALQLAQLGTRYMLALVEIGDDEKPITGKEAIPSGSDPQKPALGADNASPVRAPRSWNEITPAQQAGIRCNEPAFVKFLYIEYQRVVRSTDEARDLVCELCDVESRADIRPGTKAAEIWKRIDDKFWGWFKAPQVGAA